MPKQGDEAAKAKTVKQRRKRIRTAKKELAQADAISDLLQLSLERDDLRRNVIGQIVGKDGRFTK